MTASDEFAERRRQQQVKWMWSMLEQRMMARLRADASVRAKVKKIEAEVAVGRMHRRWRRNNRGDAGMSDRLRILVTGFGPFPGAPFNPTEPLVEAADAVAPPGVGRCRTHRPYFPGHLRRGRSRTAAADRTPSASGAADVRPGRAHAHVRMETRARNAVTLLWPDADHARLRKGSIEGLADALRFGPHCAQLQRASRGAGVDARCSRDAGRYLCNYLSWRAIEATRRDNGPRLAAFVHVPLLARGRAMRRKTEVHRITVDKLVDAGEAMLLEMVKLTRQALREAQVPASGRLEPPA